MEITEYDPPRRFVIGTTTKQVEGRHEFVLEPVTDGLRITQTGDMQPKGLMKLMAVFTGPMLRRHFRNLGEGVKSALEKP